METMIELRWVREKGLIKLQYRYRLPLGQGTIPDNWSDWIDVLDAIGLGVSFPE